LNNLADFLEHFLLVMLLQHLQSIQKTTLLLELHQYDINSLLSLQLPAYRHKLIDALQQRQQHHQLFTFFEQLGHNLNKVVFVDGLVNLVRIAKVTHVDQHVDGLSLDVDLVTHQQFREFGEQIRKEYTLLDVLQTASAQIGQNPESFPPNSPLVMARQSSQQG
jgi:hypothetical protein